MNWTINYVQGEGIINPIVYVYDIIKHNPKIENEVDFKFLMKKCLDYLPHRPATVLGILEDNYPDFISVINKYKILF